MSDIANRQPDGGKRGLTGAILAGGMSRRMGGSPKARLPFHDELLVQRQIRRLRTICTELVLVTNEPRTYLPLVDPDVRIITDYYAGKGPLGGMHAALSLAGHASVWLVGCDMPFVSPAAAEVLLERKEAGDLDAAVPYVDGRLHPLHGIYDKRCAARIAARVGEERLKVQALLEDLICEQVAETAFASRGIDSRFVLNVNTPAEYEQALRMDH